MESELVFSEAPEPKLSARMEKLIQARNRAEMKLREQQHKESKQRRRQDAQRKILLGAAVLKSKDQELLDRLVGLLEPRDRGKFRALSEQLGDLVKPTKDEL